MSKKTYIKVNEFIKSWNKNQHDLDNLDFAMYRMVNLLGYELEYKLFKSQNPFGRLNLSYEQICELSFMIVDRLEVFFRKNCSSCKLQCYRSINSNDKIPTDKLPNSLKHYINNGEEPTHLDCLKLDLSLNVIEPRMQRFIEKQKLVIRSEDKIQINQISKFIEDNIIYFLLNECYDLVLNPDEKSLKDFSETSVYDDLFSSKFQDIYSSGNGSLFDSGFSEEDEIWRKVDNDYGTMLIDFIDNYRTPRGVHNSKIKEELFAFKNFLEFINKDISEISPINFFKYLATYFIKNNTIETNDVIRVKLTSFKVFAEKIDLDFELDNYKMISNFIDSKKEEIIRVSELSNTFISDFDITEDLFSDNAFDKEIAGYFAIVGKENSKQLTLINLLTEETHNDIHLNHAIEEKLMQNDILYCRIVKVNNNMKIHEIFQIFPSFSKPYLH